jgi:large subunit ribosomal protein L34
MSITLKANNRKKKKRHGFLTRMKTKSGRAVINRRRAKGRRSVGV